MPDAAANVAEHVDKARDWVSDLRDDCAKLLAQYGFRFLGRRGDCGGAGRPPGGEDRCSRPDHHGAAAGRTAPDERL